MEGPTPVSALIHAATMVAAGVYLVGRVYPVFTPDAFLVIAYIGLITRLKEIIREICAEYDWEIEALEVMVDHVHLFASCPPRYAPAQVMNTLKSLTARALYEEFPRLKKVLWGGHIWADGYYVGSSGEHVTSDLIRHYMEYQKAEENGPKQLRLFETPPARPARSKRVPR